MNKIIYAACVFTIVVCMLLIQLLFCLSDIPFSAMVYPMGIVYGMSALSLTHLLLLIFSTYRK